VPRAALKYNHYIYETFVDKCIDMKRPSILAIFLLSAFCAFSKKHGTAADAGQVLYKTLDKLKGLRTLSYTYTRIIDYPGEAYHDETTINAYLDFNPAAQVIGLRYQFSNDKFLAIYNGSESFYCNKKGKTIAVNYSPTLETFKNSSGLFNSYITLKNALPGIINDSAVPKMLYDTTITGRVFYVADITLKNKTLNSLGDYVPTTMELKFSYKLIIDKITFMPVEIIQHTLSNQDITKTKFSDINFAPASKTDNSWYSSSYENSYAAEKPAKSISLLSPGTAAPESSLAFFSNDKATTAISNFRGNVVLLEFWIKDCGHCIEDVPQLNALYNKYKSKNFKLLAINTHDTKNMIDFFIKKHGVNYDVLIGSNAIEETYGISGFPAIVLIDKSGTILYSGYGFDEKKLDALVGQNI